MTGLSNDIQSIWLDEFCNCQYMSDGILAIFGFGSTAEGIAANPVAATISSDFLPMGMHYLADRLGMPIARVECTAHHGSVDRDIVLPGVITAKAGTVSTVSYRWAGDAGGRPMYVIQVHRYLHESLRAATARGDDYWLLQVEGQPSTRLVWRSWGGGERVSDARRQPDLRRLLRDRDHDDSGHSVGHRSRTRPVSALHATGPLDARYARQSPDRVRT